MNYLSVCSGIEAATVAWDPLDWKPVGFSEIEPFPAAVLNHHYPVVPNFGDMTKYKEWNLDTDSVDLLVGGTPCQSFSVAGLRKGLDDPRGNLALVYCGMLDYFRPKWFVWENVPGVLSSSGGRDFGAFLGAVAQLGYGFSYRVLDAQYFGVAQRRRRVFVVGHLGDWQRAAAVLFESQSLRRDTAPSREAGQEVANCLGASPSSASCPNVGSGQGTVVPVSVDVLNHTIGDIAHTLSARNDMQTGAVLMSSVAQPIAFQSVDHGADATENLSPTLRRHDPMAVMHPMSMQISNGEPRLDDVAATLDCWSTGGRGSSQQQGVLCMPSVAHPVAYAFDSLSSNSMKSSNPISGCNQVEVSKTLDTSRGLDPSCNQGGIGIQQSMAVRRLTPVECERLQGFPDNYTNIPWRKKDESPDGPRYKALGNSMAVPVMRWIGERIAKVEAL